MLLIFLKEDIRGALKNTFQIEDNISWGNPEGSKKSVSNTRCWFATPWVRQIPNAWIIIFKKKIMVLHPFGDPHAQKCRLIIFTHVYPYLPQILKTWLGEKQFFNRRYCLTTNGEAETTVFQIEDIDYIHPYLLQILKTRLGDKHFLNRRYCMATHGGSGNDCFK